MSESYDLILVGTGFASSFFLHGYLGRAGSRARVLAIERGEMRSHAWQLQHPRRLLRAGEESYRNLTPQKPWVFSVGFGGSSNCWWANTPRMLPEDFELRSRYGVGVDWPVTYDALEPYYSRAEGLMSIAGPPEAPYPRSGLLPQPPHRLTEPERLLKRAYPEQFFSMPCARPSRGTPRRPRCCASGVCVLCPIDSKFTILNEMRHLYDDPRVSLRLNAAVQRVDAGGGVARGVEYVTADGTIGTVRGELIVLGANAIFNPHILLRSGLDHPQLGRGLNEQASARVRVLLDGVDNYQGTTSITGHGFMLYPGEHRRRRAAALIETSNVPQLRDVPGRWRQVLLTKFIFEELRSPDSRVTVDSDDPTKPAVTFTDYGERTRVAIAEREADAARVFAPLPVERIEVSPAPLASTAHILGTTVMGDDARESVVDRHLVHHKVRNLVVVGASVFPTTAPAHPTLTVAALSLWSAEHIAR